MEVPEARTWGAHSHVLLGEPANWRMMVSHSSRPVRRLVVFIHGFNGHVLQTWHDFPAGTQLEDDWWRDSDLLFVSYRSTRENISAVAHRIRRHIAQFYPSPNAEALGAGGEPPREDVRDYSELVLVGHSLGGLVVRRAMVDAALESLEPGMPRSPLLDAQIRLFSPASAGFRASGLLGMVAATPVWAAIEMFVRRSSAYTDLQPGSAVLRDTRERTESLAQRDEFSNLRAHIIWASPDDVVIAERYHTDFVDDAIDATTHSSICKPKPGFFEAPYAFVQEGRLS